MAILRKDATGPFYMRWRDRETGQQVTRTTEHRTLTKAKAVALEKSLELAQGRAGTPEPRRRTKGPVTWGALLDWFEKTWVPLAASEAERSYHPQALAVWRTVLPLNAAVANLEPSVIADFKQRRKAGTLQVDGFTLRAKVSERTIGRDLEWLRRVVNKGIESPSIELTVNPIKSTIIPKTPHPKRPVATAERYATLRAHADMVGGQKLFGGFLDLLRALGWRVTAVCSIRLDEIDTTSKRWKIKKRGEVDKNGVEVWVWVSEQLKPQLRALIKAREKLKVDSPWLFPKPEKPAECWQRHYVRDRLETAEKAAGLTPLDGGDFHPYRRLWGTERKHLPLVDVAKAGGWKSPRMLQELYQQVSPEDEWQVMNLKAGVTS